MLALPLLSNSTSVTARNTATVIWRCPRPLLGAAQGMRFPGLIRSARCSLLVANNERWLTECRSSAYVWKSAPLVATLVSNGQVVASAAEAGVVPQGSSSWEPYNQQWAKFSLNATLQQGQTYQLELSAPAGTVYTVNGVRDGNAAGYGFSPNTVFSDGYANYNTGSGWTQGWDTWGGSPVKDQDLSFYFSSSVVTPPAPPPPSPSSYGNVVGAGALAEYNGNWWKAL